MARISKFIQYKPAVERLFQASKVSSDVYSLFSAIPQSTIRDWHESGINDGRWQAQKVPSLPTASLAMCHLQASTAMMRTSVIMIFVKKSMLEDEKMLELKDKA